MENIKDNYFTIFSAADKEMIHSAMLAYLLNKGDFFYQKLFPVLAKLSNKLEAECEKKINHGRLDVAVMEGDNIVLVIETKFKSQPRLTQLEKYSKRLKQATHKYLLVFNPEDLDVDIQKSEWKTISYQHISTTLKEYLATNDEISKKERLLYKEYIAFLDYYIHYSISLMNIAYILKPVMRHFWRHLQMGQAYFSPHCHIILW